MASFFQNPKLPPRGRSVHFGRACHRQSRILGDKRRKLVNSRRETLCRRSADQSTIINQRTVPQPKVHERCGIFHDESQQQESDTPTGRETIPCKAAVPPTADFVESPCERCPRDACRRNHDAITRAVEQTWLGRFILQPPLVNKRGLPPLATPLLPCWSGVLGWATGSASQREASRNIVVVHTEACR